MRAQAALHEDTVKSWQEELGEPSDAQGDEAGRRAPPPERLQHWLEELVATFFPLAQRELGARPALRLQAQGQSFSPDRMDKLLAKDERLDRQCEKTLAMLIRLQERRRDTGAPSPTQGRRTPALP